MRKWKSFKKIIISILIVTIVLPGWVLGSPIIQKPESALAATSVGGGGNVVGGIINMVGLNPLTIGSDVIGDLNSQVIIEISQNTASKLEFNTLPTVVAMPVFAGLDLGAGDGNPILLTPSASKITIPVITSPSPANNGIIVSGIFVKATKSGVSSSYAGTENLIIKTAGGTIDGSPIIVDTQFPNFTGITSTPKYAKVGNVDLSFTASESLMGNPDVLVNVKPATFISVNNLTYHYNYTITAADSEGQATINIVGPDANFNFDLAGVTDTQALFIDMTSPSVPTNVTASLAGNVITVDWDDVVDSGSGLSGYNIYSSVDGFANKINPSLILAATSTFGDTIHSNGNYSYKIEAIDNAGNISAKSASSNTATLNLLPAVTGLSAQPGNGEVQLTWDIVPGASGYLVRYFLASDPQNQLAAVSVAGNTTKISNLTNGAVYRFEVQAVDSVSGMLGTSAAVTATPTAPAPPVARATVTPVVNTAPISQTTAPAPTTTTPSATPTEQGKIKGEQVAQNATQNEAFNWTPWIILIIIIVLAGAATGGYFYWTRGEETPVPQITVTRKTSGATKVSADKKASPTKKNRW